eukprot:TRINITY_DN13213_c0_g1_i1.p1 TRINITY_DN13213_c0_g1~~TRINITY_DN13213_c0_g1_i1.p1  ORF type:complete len:191 (+),score=38.90 TRINITY_DN13213_c0_g1_i1:27-599(+)
MSNPIKVVVIGDKTVGKTCFMIRCATGKFQHECIPTVADTHSCDVVLGNGTSVSVEMWDTGGAKDDDSISYRHIEVFLLCYSVASPTSFANIRSLWIPEVDQRAPGKPVLLVGTKSDLGGDQMETQLADNGLPMITHRKAQDMAHDVGALDALECSALTGDGVKEVLDTLIAIAMERRMRKKNSLCCCLL